MKTLRERYRKKNPVLPEKKPIRQLTRIVKKKIYVKQKCAYVDNGKPCTRNAIGKGQLCFKHGGTKDITNTLSPEATQLYLAGNGDTVKYIPGLHPMQYIDLSRQGFSQVEIAAELQVGVPTLNTWSEKFQEFALAYDIGQALHEAWWLTKGKAGLDQRNFNTPLFKFLTGNKLGYADKVESKNMNMNVHGVLVVPEKQTISEWEASGVQDDK